MDDRATVGVADRLLTYDDVQQRLGVSLSFVKKQVRKGRLQRLLVGDLVRFTEVDLARYLQSCVDGNGR